MKRTAHIKSNSFMGQHAKNAENVFPGMGQMVRNAKEADKILEGRGSNTPQTLENVWKNSKNRAFSVSLNVAMRMEDVQSTNTYELSSPMENGPFPYLAMSRSVYSLEAGRYMPQALQFIQNPSALSRHTFQAAVIHAVSGNSPVMPLRLSYLGRGFGYILPYEMYKDLFLLLSILGHRGGDIDNYEVYAPLKPYSIVGTMANTIDDARSGMVKMLKNMRGSTQKAMVLTALARVTEFHAISHTPNIVAVIMTEKALDLIRDYLQKRHPFLFQIDASQCPTGPMWIDFIRDVLQAGVSHAGPPQPEPETAPVSDAAPQPEESVQPAGESSPNAARQHRKKVLEAPPAILGGLDADTLLEEVTTNPSGYFACEVDGIERLSPEVLSLVREPSTSEASRTLETAEGRKVRPVATLTQLAQGKLAVMEWGEFLATVDDRRHPARRWLEKRLGFRLGKLRAHMVDIGPERIGEVPALVAGQHRADLDRLCTVRIVFRNKVTMPTYAERCAIREERRNKSVIVIKRHKAGESTLRRQKFRFAIPPMLVVFPSAWLAAVSEPWMPGLFGTPYDPALLDFCETMPQTWWENLAAVTPPADPAQRTLNVRTLNSAT